MPTKSDIKKPRKQLEEELAMCITSRDFYKNRCYLQDREIKKFEIVLRNRDNKIKVLQSKILSYENMEGK